MSLGDYILRNVSNLKKAGNRGDKGPEYSSACPFCGGKDRFRIWPESSKPGWWCRQCLEHGDVIDFVRKVSNVTYARALEILGIDESVASLSAPTAPAPPKAEEMVASDVAEVIRRSARNKIQATAYFAKYGLPREAVDRYWLGYMSQPIAYTIPHFVTLADGTRQPKGIKIRLRYVNGPNKYLTYKTSPDKHYQMSGVFQDGWISAPDGTREGPKLPYLFITEDEKSCLVLNWLGYPAIAYMPRSDWNYYLPACLKNVDRVIIVADNDSAKDNNNAGAGRALNVQKWVGKPCDIIMHPTYNDIADIAKFTNTEEVNKWILNSVQLKPLSPPTK